jgi:XTP/dITP diphosphohydrolase
MTSRSKAAPLLLATRSLGKLRELRPLFESCGVAIVDLDDLGLPRDADEDAIEEFETFEENALAKARYFFEASGGIATVADDSGLEVLALGGAPGVLSKRWHQAADADGSRKTGDKGPASEGTADVDAANNAMLVQAVAALTDRRARYVCAAAYSGLGGHEIVHRGEVAGTIITEPRGRAGFGYDPYFVADELSRTFGEATLEEKARVSHRSRAFRALLGALVPTSR